VLQQLKSTVKTFAYRAVPGRRFIARGPATGNRLALTFDDGPCEMSLAYLDLLDRLMVPATFFVVGDRVEQYPDIMREYIRRGHQVAGHGFDHARFTNLSVAELADQLRRTEAAIGPQNTARPWVRPPFGAIGAKSLLQIVASGRVTAMWSFDSEDYNLKTVDALLERCTPQAVTAGDVILFHEEQQWTFDALAPMIERWRHAGFSFVTMADLFAA
jgi:peptidoglycan-N-acetylglucosamine deacetylase